MALYLYQAWNSNDIHSATKQKESTSEAVYVVTGSDDHTAVEAYASTAGPIADNGRLRESIDLERIAPETWIAVYKFGHEDSDSSSDEQQPSDPSEFTFDTTGGTGHIDISRGTTRYDPLQAPDFKGAIGVKKEGSDFTVEGVDIILPTFKYSEKKVFLPAAVTLAYAKTVSELTGTVNDANFKGWNSGEVLFTGANGTRRGGGNWELNFAFEMTENEHNLVIGEFNGISKEGWQYLWVLYRTVEDGTAKSLVKRPQAVYVEDIYQKKDFAQLGIGT